MMDLFRMTVLAGKSERTFKPFPLLSLDGVELHSIAVDWTTRGAEATSEKNPTPPKALWRVYTENGDLVMRLTRIK